MAIVERKTAKGVVYYLAIKWQGRVYWERCGMDKREAARLHTQRKKEVKAKTYQPPESRRIVRVSDYAEQFLAGRKNRSVEDERRCYRLHIKPRTWFSDLKIEEVNHGHVERLVAELKAARHLTDKSIGNVIGVLSVMFASAIRGQHYRGANPASLPRGVLKREPVKERETFTGGEIRTLTRNVAVSWPGRVQAALAFYTGCRLGEVCGLTWGDLDTATEPLWALDVTKQYGGGPLKTERARCVPVHPELQAILEAWGKEGFELHTTRKPRPEDFILPNSSVRANARHHTKKTGMSLFARSCREAGISERGGIHATRHTFITLTRRGGALRERLEVVTHNARGQMIDRYTHWDWAPLCEAVLCLDLDSVRSRQLPRRPAGFLASFDAPENESSAPNRAKALTSTGDNPCSIPGASIKKHLVKQGFSEGRLYSDLNSDPRETTPNLWALKLAAEALGLRSQAVGQ